MAQWTHPICRQCYAKREPNREPLTVQDAGVEICCDCGDKTQDGIYIRADPKTLLFADRG